MNVIELVEDYFKSQTFFFYRHENWILNLKITVL